MSDPKPLPCPFCGDEPYIMDDPSIECQVSCSRERGNDDEECWACPFVDGATVEIAVALWNHRAAATADAPPEVTEEAIRKALLSDELDWLKLKTRDDYEMAASAIWAALCRGTGS